MLNRRSLFGASAAVAVAAVPALASAAPADDWDALIAGLRILHPGLPELAIQARDQGYKASELRIVMIPQNGERPFLEFYRDFLTPFLREVH